MFECPRCFYRCKLKTDIKRHLARKNKCEPILDDIDIDTCLSMIDNKEIVSIYSIKDKIKEQYKKIKEQNNEIEKLKKENILHEKEFENIRLKEKIDELVKETKY